MLTMSLANISKTAKRQKELYDAKLSLQRYKPGDLVWFLSSSQQLDMTPKLQKQCEGPCLILKRINDINYRIQTSSKRRSRKLVHHDKLKPYRGSKRLSWAKSALRDTQ